MGRLLWSCRPGWAKYLFPVSSWLQQVLLLALPCLNRGGPGQSVPSPYVSDPWLPNPTSLSASPHCPPHVNDNTCLLGLLCCVNKLMHMKNLEQCLQLTPSAPPSPKPPASVLICPELSLPMFVELDPSSKSARLASLGKYFNRSKPQFFHLYNRGTFKAVVRNEWGNALKRSIHSAGIGCGQTPCSGFVARTRS